MKKVNYNDVSITFTSQPQIDEDERSERQNAWRLAVERSMRWTKIKKIEQKRINYRRRSSLPIGLFLISSFAMLVLSRYIKNS